MKKLCLQVAAVLLLCAALLPFTGCFKDTSVKHFTMYRPLYKTLPQVQSEVKSTAPVPVSQPGKMFVIGSYIFLSEKNKGVHIIDNANPAAPINKAFIPIPGNGDIAVYGTTLYADCFSYLFAIDITNPMQARLTQTTANMFPDRNFLNGFRIDSANIIYDWSKKDTAIKTDLDNYSSTGGSLFTCPSCSLVQSFSVSAASLSSSGVAVTGQGGSMARFAVLNNYLYAVTTNQLKTLSLSQPEQPLLKNTLSLGGGIETVYPFADKLFIGSNSGMGIYSVANPQQPVYLSSFSHATVCDPVITDGRHAYVTLRNGTTCRGTINQLDVVDVQNVVRPYLIKSYPLTNPHGLSKDGQWLFICDGKDGLKCFDASNPAAVILKSTIAMPVTYDVICQNGVAIVSAEDGLYQYDYSDINNIKRLSKISLSLF